MQVQLGERRKSLCKFLLIAENEDEYFIHENY